MDAKKELVSFIGTSFRSVWALELLCHLRKSGDEASTAEGLVESLRASDLVIDTSVSELVAVGLVSTDTEGKVRYAPASEDLERLAGEAQAFYEKSPNAVRRIIIRAANPGLVAFSDAFRLGGG